MSIIIIYVSRRQQMNEAKFTKGPLFKHSRVGFSRYIAITMKETEGNPKWDIARVYGKADADLFAAAYSQHRALSKAYIQLLKNYAPERYTPGYQVLLGECRDALADALGISSETVQNACEAEAAS